MSDLHEVRDPDHEPQIDAEGWLFLVLAVGIITTAVLVAYQSHDTEVANTPVSQVVATALLPQQLTSKFSLQLPRDRQSLAVRNITSQEHRYNL